MSCPDKQCLTCTTHIWIRREIVEAFLESCLAGLQRAGRGYEFYFNQCIRLIHILKWWRKEDQ